MTDHTLTSRRALLAGAPAAVVTLATGSAALASEGDGPSPILKLFREWQALTNAADDRNITDEEASALCDRARAVEDHMLALPSTSAADFAAKVCAYTSFGNFTLSADGASALWAEMHELLDLDRQLDAAIAAVPVAAPAPADPILDLYRQWLEARRDWYDRTKGTYEDDDPRMLALMAEWNRLTEEIGRVGPSSREGMAAMLHVQWVEFGPTAATWAPDYEKECNHPENAFIAHAWRAATGKDGWPRAEEAWEPVEMRPEAA